MSVNAIDNSENPLAAQKNAASSPDALRRAAVQFEAVLLMQLTSAMNGSGDDENALFGGDGGTNLAKQMFSEQMATTMADSGGVGLADLLMQQFGGSKPQMTNTAGKLAGLMSAVKDAQNKTSVTSASVENAALAGVTPANEAIPAPANAVRPRVVPEALAANTDRTVSEANFGFKTVERMNYQMPVNGRLSSGFGNRFHPIDKKAKFHAGIDIAAPKGTPIAAAAEGVVTFSGWKNGYGNLVVISHPDGRETRYGHAEKLFVKEGETVAAGQQIAAVGSTGKSTGPHLHFEVREDGRAVDPRNFLSNVLPRSADR